MNVEADISREIDTRGLHVLRVRGERLIRYDCWFNQFNMDPASNFTKRAAPLILTPLKDVEEALASTSCPLILTPLQDVEEALASTRPSAHKYAQRYLDWQRDFGAV